MFRLFPTRGSRKCLCQLLLLSLAIAVLMSGNSQVTADELNRLEQQAFQEAVALVSPSVVRIQTVGGSNLVGKQLARTAATTGVIVSSDGFIISSAFNFIAKPSAILVEFSTGEQLPAQLIATDRVLKLTLLKVDASQLLPIRVPSNNRVEVGQWAIAVGRMYSSPSPSISIGVVSALNRIRGRALQTDAKVSPVNYGGPLINVKGEPLGILVPLSPNTNAANAGVEWYDSGIGFAVPIEAAIRSFERMKKGDDLKSGKLGIDFKKGGVGAAAVINRIWGGSPAYNAGFQIGDEITQVGKQKIHSQANFKLAIGTKYASDQIKVTIKRGDESITKTITLVDALVPYELPFLGILAERANANSGPSDSVVIRFVFPDGPADKAGLQPQDRLLKFNQQAISNAADLRNRLSQQQPGEVIDVELDRNGKSISKQVTLSNQPADIPADIPTAIDTPDSPTGNDPATAEFKRGEIDGQHQELKYWAYVPQDETDRRRYALLVWLHPANKGMKKEVLDAWKSTCDRRGIVLLAPQTNGLKAWEPGDSAVLKELIDEFIQTYPVDAKRVVAHGAEKSGTMAYELAFKYRQLFRGVAVIDSRIAASIPQNLPDEQIDFFLVGQESGSNFSRIKKHVAILQKLKHSVHFRAVPQLTNGYVSPPLVDEMAGWLDILDRY